LPDGFIADVSAGFPENFCHIKRSICRMV
jgi:hypothetical protein